MKDDEKTDPSLQLLCVRVGPKSKCLGDGEAKYVYTWPGREPEAVCEGCGGRCKCCQGDGLSPGV